jgi:serine/threonine protein kinase
MPTALTSPDRVTLLREISGGPVSALFVAERRRGSDIRLVAVKVLRRRRARDLEQLARIRDTGRKIERLGHPSAVAVTDLAVIEGQPALLSPWIEGVDLLDWVEVLRETNNTLPVRAVCEVLRSAAAALDAALGRTPWGEQEPLGAMHRDVKPSNLMISRDGDVKLLDFGTGLTTLAGREARQIATEVGAARYLSPGRRAGKRGSSASDVYALGLIGIEALSGRWLQRVRDSNPAHDRHLAEVVASLPPLDLRSPQDDRTLRSLLLRMVAFDPEARPSAAEATQTMRTLADRCPGPSLQSFAHDHALPWLVPPEAQDGLPEGTVVEPEALPSLVRAEPDEFIDLPLDPGTEESVWEAHAAVLEGLEDTPIPSATRIVAVPSPVPPPPRESVPLQPVPLAGTPSGGEKGPSLPVVAGTVFAGTVVVGAGALVVGVVVGVLVGVLL